MSGDTKHDNQISKKEEEVLSFWNRRDIFRKSLEKKSPKGDFVFYDGPPFATGTPHYGHLTASAIKDAIPRYKTMCGFRVERQWGWDCHGLPIENIVEKELGTKSKKDIEALGIGKFNQLCRKKIFSYVDAWNELIPRFGRWADMKHPYRTMDVSYMESEWWAFKKLYSDGLLYKDYRSLYICPRCETTLAQSEVTEGYKTIKDLSVTAKFELVDEPGTYFLAWTTTPWTLPGNVALAVNDKVIYCKFSILNSQFPNEYYIAAKDRLSEIAKGEHKIVKEFSGKELAGKKYKPLFDDYAKDALLKNCKNGWKVYAAPFVTTAEGVGIVHIAPAFGQDDLELSRKEKLPFIQHVGMDGVIKKNVKELAGLSVKPAHDPHGTDVAIIKHLAARGLLFSKEKYEHSYPHCWRCDTPLLNYATDSWFVAVQKIKDKLLEYSNEITWFPAHTKEGRWGEWLKGARDWSVSRQRFWANVIPVWVNEKTGAHTVIGSIEELKNHTKKSGNTYYLMRHGESEHNMLGVANSKDMEKYGLTEKGKRVVLKRARAFKKNGIDFIFYSPFRRTRETAEIFAREAGLFRGALFPESRLREVNVGIFDGKNPAEYHAFFSSMEEKFAKTPLRGENLMELKNRVTGFLYDIEKKYTGKNILIISHEYPLWLLCAGAHGMNVFEAAKEKGKKEDYIDTGEMRLLPFVPLSHDENFELDLHRPYIDEVEIVDKDGVPLRRVPDVLDTWFDSGSVPFSSRHYPFENKKKVEGRIPADFIGEGQDQVSKWFYYQHVLSGGLFKKHAFKNVIVNGIMLAEDGKKMSKRLLNYPDPAFVVQKYGADAVRLYLLSSSVVRAENLSFSEEGVADISRKVFGRIDNVYAFYALYKDEIAHSPTAISKNVLDRFIIGRLQETGRMVTRALDHYELDGAARHIIDFIDDLSTWYIRRSRERFKSEDAKDKKSALQTTAWVLREYAKLMAPFAPFMAEWLWQNLKEKNDEESVHLEKWSVYKATEDSKVLVDMDETRRIVSLGLELRMKHGIKVRQPLAVLKLNYEPGLSFEYLDLIKNELNIKEIRTNEDIPFEVELDTRITPELEKEGQLRELTRSIQELRKKEELNPHEKITLFVKTDEKGKRFVREHESALKKTTGLKDVLFEDTSGKEIIIDSFRFIFSVKK